MIHHILKPYNQEPNSTRITHLHSLNPRTGLYDFIHQHSTFDDTPLTTKIPTKLTSNCANLRYLDIPRARPVKAATFHQFNPTRQNVLKIVGIGGYVDFVSRLKTTIKQLISSLRDDNN